MSIVLPPTTPVAEPEAIAPARPIPRKLALRVSGARPGSAARPVASTEPAEGARLVPRFGLRVHSSTLAPRPAPVATVIDPSEYASLDDYEDGR
jgi:hypothetical protein